jgi:hypothetical protein
MALFTQASNEEKALTKELFELKRKISQTQIDHDREKEGWQRERREVEHMVGLQKNRADQERELAVKAAQLEVREGNLKTKEDGFEERMEKVTAQLTDQIAYLRNDIIKAILERLPTFNVDTVLGDRRLLPEAKD